LAASGYSIAQVFDVPAGEAENNIIANKPGVKLAETSLIEIFLTREAVGIEFNVTVGGTNVYPQPGPANINTVDGTLPSVQDDGVIDTIAQGGDEIIISATNSSAGDLEARALVKVMPIGDAMLRTAVKLRTNA